MQLENYLKLAKEIADESAVIALKYFGFETEKTWKSDNTPLTQADTEINSLVIKKIQEKYPEHSIQGEEESSKKVGSKYIWVCDPIDGTMPFSLGLPIFTFSLALGGKATDLNGGERRYDEEGDGIVLSNGILHDEILSCIKVGK
ncbi:MAG: inositol monophosphatase family protein [Candidatus Taylorbacteria bacterium]|nr:inositol monophosphatase family protein [Candidatus Taylorbacteria bacterium]